MVAKRKQSANRGTGGGKSGGTSVGRDEIPSTVRRSDAKAERTYKETLESARETYGEGARARRTAFSSLKHTHEKVGDHWEPKNGKGPSDAQAEQKGTKAREKPRATAAGVDANASLKHLREVARRLEIRGRSTMSKDELVSEIKKANRRQTSASRGR
jgi:hypothetical protein